MGAKGMLAAMVFGTVGVIATFHRSDSHDVPAEPPPIAEVPWLSREAANQIIGGVMPGPLFDDVMFGAPVSRQARARIAQFARDHSVEIDLEMHEGDLAGIRFAVEFGGCCGYEGADVLALKLLRPTRSTCCGCQQTWIDDWSIVHDGLFMRASVRVNRVDVRWERALALPELLARAGALVGTNVSDLRDDQLSSLGERRYRLRVPFAFSQRFPEWRDDTGLELFVERGKIASVSFAIYDLEEADQRFVSRWRRAKRSRYVVTGRDLERTTITIR